MQFFFHSESRACRRCGQTFTAKHPYQYYCGESCRRQGSPKVTRICQACGREFEIKQHYVDHGQGKYCSVECWRSKNKPIKAWVGTRICSECGSAFETRDKRQIYCSEGCRRKGAPSITLECQVCGNEFEIEKYVYEHQGRKYCSIECYQKRKGRVDKVCAHCGKTFQVAKWYALKGFGKYCSKECQTAAYRNNPSRVVLICQQCGKEFTTKKSQIEWHNRRFCSQQCALNYRGETSIEQLIRVELQERGIEFDQNVPIGKFTVDFLLYQAKIVIECDGEYWHSLPDSKKRDKYKDKFLFQKGFQVFRFTESEIRRAARDCVDRVLRG